MAGQTEEAIRPRVMEELRQVFRPEFLTASTRSSCSTPSEEGARADRGHHGPGTERPAADRKIGCPSRRRRRRASPTSGTTGLRGPSAPPGDPEEIQDPLAIRILEGSSGRGPNHRRRRNTLRLHVPEGRIAAFPGTPPRRVQNTVSQSLTVLFRALTPSTNCGYCGLKTAFEKASLVRS